MLGRKCSKNNTSAHDRKPCTVQFFSLKQPEWKIFKSKIETKLLKDLLCITAIKTPLKIDDFVYRFEN